MNFMNNKNITKTKVYFTMWITLWVILAVFFWYQTIKYNYISDIVEKELKTTSNLKEAYFAAGCFWCTESSYEKYKEYWVIDVVSWYAWGTIINPTYSEVGKGNTWHREAVKVYYDADRISYNDLLQIFWRTANPTDDWGQYVDRWFVYSSAIFYVTDDEKNLAIKSSAEIQSSGRFGDKKIITPILKYTNFYDAEEYHQDFYIKNPVRYNVYTNWSWRKQFLKSIWWNDLQYNILNKKNAKDSKIVTKNYKWELLTKLQYKITQKKWTERAFNNIYWDNTDEWIYVDLIDGTPLYSSIDKYKSWTGWPTFFKPIDIKNISEKEDKNLFTTRTEIIWTNSRSHIGHVFTDWPVDKWWLRYCMNSASLDFIPKEKLESEWYWEYLVLF